MAKIQADTKQGREPGRHGVSAQLLDKLLEEYQGPGSLSDPQTLLKGLTSAVLTRAMEAELDHHLGYERGQEPPAEQTNRRNGKSSKRLRTEQGDLQVDVP